MALREAAGMTVAWKESALQPGGAWKVIRHGVGGVPDLEAEAGLLREVTGMLPPTFQEPGFQALGRTGETVLRADEEYQAVAGKPIAMQTKKPTT